jgi:periplasmic copper chaperone A
MWRYSLRGAVLAVGAALFVGVGATAASAHVTVSPDTATQGGYGALTFRVPNERDDANTTKVEVQLPLDRPVASVRVKPHPDWSYEVKKTKLPTPIDAEGGKITESVSEIVWTAQDPKAGIRPGEYEEFAISAGPLPKADSMVFKTLQHYSNGEVVRWIEEPQPGGAEPERPAPVLRLLPRSQTGTGGAPAARPPARDHAASAASPAETHWAMALSVAALVAALACAVLVVRTSRRRT